MLSIIRCKNCGSVISTRVSFNYTTKWGFCDEICKDDYSVKTYNDEPIGRKEIRLKRNHFTKTEWKEYMYYFDTYYCTHKIKGRYKQIYPHKTLPIFLTVYSNKKIPHSKKFHKN